MANERNGWRPIIALIASGVAMFGIFTTLNLTVAASWYQRAEASATDREVRIRALEHEIAQAAQWRQDVTRRLDEIKAELKEHRP